MCQSQCHCPLCPFSRLKVLPKNQIHYIEAFLWFKKHSKLSSVILKSYTRIDPNYIEDINNFFRFKEITNEKINEFFSLMEQFGKN